MKPVKILVETLVDAELTNAQMVNAREIISRLDPGRFHVSAFMRGTPDPQVRRRSNTRLIKLPARKQTLNILKEFVLGGHQILFYVKASPAAKWYMKLKSARQDGRVTVGTIESQSDWHKEPTIARQNIALLHETVLRCDYLFSNSGSVRESLQAEHGIASEVIPTGVDTKFFTPEWGRPARSRPRVLFVGSLRPFKGPQIVLEAAERFAGADFVIVGDGPMAADIAARAKLLPNLRLTGAVPRNVVREEYRRADIFLFPSRWEGSPKVIMEAAACGLPVIARKDYKPETVVDRETGYLVGSEEELFERLEGLMRWADLRQKLGRAGRDHSLKFDWDGIARRWEEAFLLLAPSSRAIA